MTAAVAPVVHARAGQPADGEEPAAPGGRVRIEFTSPAKPALITWAGPAEEDDPAPAPKKGSGGFKVPPELQPKPGETLEEKIARLKRINEEAKRAAGKL